ncbi:hypothetical protein HAX54_051895 [Datura stramonium]|uniref:Uncharacterized protein n=1 Tax=Datura stramonium TaxID=4076 RepID=A0ABS8T0C2_DATST|nr:hypothetical protein [Datura stramonium]
MYYFGLGVSDAISTVISQYIVVFTKMWYLNQRVMILPPRFEELQFGGYLTSGWFSHWKNSFCPFHNDTCYINGCPSRCCSDGCSPNMLTSLGLVALLTDTGCICTGVDC